MRLTNFHCTLLEVQTDAKKPAADEPLVRELEPWADPLMTCLLAKYRLQAALADSLSYLGQEPRLPKATRGRLSPWGNLPANWDS